MKIGDNSIGSGAQESALVTSVLAAPKKTERLRKPERLFENFFWERRGRQPTFFSTAAIRDFHSAVARQNRQPAPPKKII